MKRLLVCLLLLGVVGCGEENAVDPHLLRTIDIPKGSGWGQKICVSPDGSRFASGIGASEVEMNIWDCDGFLKSSFSKRENSLVTFINPRELPVDGIVFSPDWSYFATYKRISRRQQGLNIWSYRDRDPGRFVLPDLPDSGVDLAIFDTKGERLAYLQNNATSEGGHPTVQVTIRSGKSFRESVTLENVPEAKQINLMAFSPGGDRLVARTIHDGLIMWDLNTEKLIFTDYDWEAQPGVDILMFSPDGKQFVVIGSSSSSGEENSSGGGGIEIRNSDDGNLVKNTLGYRPISISRDWKWFATTKSNHKKDMEDIQIHDMENGDIEFTLRGHTGHIVDVDFSADRSRLVSVAIDRTFKIWDLTDLSSP